ncbi:uncharacterized protein LOC133335999 [Musca vetustissima]|uniref:uncharacterized protein LOC133335999 n=1 Tax=Musca vetustissima TaxID=27455 RepID=UPI002AB6C315|nr:uncharacterized protein LOC133335999 [Musca vetustissima]
MFFKNVLMLLVVVIAAVKAQNTTNNITAIRIDDYIAANKRNYENNVKEYDFKLQAFEELYNGRLNTIDVQKDFMIDSLKLTNERLSTLEFLSDYSKNCVAKYQTTLPTEYNVTVTLQNCTASAKSYYNTLVTDARTTRNSLEYYYDVTLNNELKKCDNIVNKTSQANYTLCVTNVIENANVYTIENRKAFNSQMETANCAANGQVHKALDCSFTAQSNTFQLMSTVNIQIDMCIQGTNSTACSGYYCQNVERIPANSINPKNQTMTNPFFGRNETLSCLMLDIV